MWFVLMHVCSVQLHICVVCRYVCVCMCVCFCFAFVYVCVSSIKTNRVVAECSIVKVILPGTSNPAQAKFVPGPVLWNQDPATVNKQADKVIRCVHVHMCVHAHVCVYMHVCVCVYMHVCVCVCMHACMRVCTYTMNIHHIFLTKNTHTKNTF